MSCSQNKCFCRPSIHAVRVPRWNYLILSSIEVFYTAKNCDTLWNSLKSRRILMPVWTNAQIPMRIDELKWSHFKLMIYSSIISNWICGIVTFKNEIYQNKIGTLCCLWLDDDDDGKPGLSTKKKKNGLCLKMELFFQKSFVSTKPSPCSPPINCTPVLLLSCTSSWQDSSGNRLRLI